MTGKTDFTEEEWKTVLEAPPSAGLLVITSDRAGSIRETFSMAKHITDAVGLLKEKATAEGVEEYKKFSVVLEARVAEARKEGFLGLSGERVSDDEKAAITEVEAALG